jgi:hypothetical protein
MKKAGVIFLACFSLMLIIASGCSNKNPGTPAPAQTCGYAFGNNMDNDTMTWTGGYLFACPFTPASAVKVSSLSVKLDGAGAITYEAGIYSDNSGAPADQLSQTGVIVNGAPGWNSVTITAVDLNVGNTYWLVVISDNPGIRADSGAGSCKYSLILWSTVSAGLPPDLSYLVWNSLTDEIKIYAIGCK